VAEGGFGVRDEIFFASENHRMLEGVVSIRDPSEQFENSWCNGFGQHWSGDPPDVFQVVPGGNDRPGRPLDLDETGK
jgi:hypothetical protein